MILNHVKAEKCNQKLNKFGYDRSAIRETDCPYFATEKGCHMLHQQMKDSMVRVPCFVRSVIQQKLRFVALSTTKN